MKKFRALILSNELPDDHLQWEKTCLYYKDQVDYRIVNLTSSTWFEEIQSQPFDILLAKPPGLTAPFKQLYDERIYILGKVLGYKVFPSPDEIFIYENKRFFSFWLKANKIPHPDTHVFYNRKEAEYFIKTSTMPLVAKTNIGASGSGVKVLHQTSDAFAYIHQTFSGKGAPKRSGPNFSKGGLPKRVFHYVLHPSDIANKFSIYRSKLSDRQTGYVIFQVFVPHDFEWRVVRIGDSFFAHKKLKKGEKTSGALLKGYETPPFSLLDFVKQITDQHNFYTQAIDIFESDSGYIVNEMQCMFGQSDPYQMLVDGKPGRYKYFEEKWIFEEGDFDCYNLRLEYIMKMLNNPMVTDTMLKS